MCGLYGSVRPLVRQGLYGMYWGCRGAGSCNRRVRYAGVAGVSCS
jgi:hypothetical protein